MENSNRHFFRSQVLAERKKITFFGDALICLATEVIDTSFSDSNSDLCELFSGEFVNRIQSR